MTPDTELPSNVEEFRAELPGRVCEALKRESVYTWDEAAQISETVWLNAPNFGRKALQDLKTAMARRGLQTPEDLAKDMTGLGKNRHLYQATLINIALAYSGLRDSEILMTDVLRDDQTRFNPPRLYISRKAAEILRTHPELRVLDVQDADAIAFDPDRRTDPERRAEIAGQLSASGGGLRCTEIIEKFSKQAGVPAKTLGEISGKTERRSDLSEENQDSN